MDIFAKFGDSRSNRSRDTTASLCDERRQRQRRRRPTDLMAIEQNAILAFCLIIQSDKGLFDLQIQQQLHISNLENIVALAHFADKELFLPLDKAIASRAVFVIVSGSDGQTGGWAETLLEPPK